MNNAVGTTAVRDTAVGRLVRIELKLMLREPLTLIFVFVFPVVTMLIIGGSFGTTPTVAFDWVNPSQWYVASYLTVVIAATGLIMVPVHLASYRERGVLRRFAAAGFPRWSFALAELVTGLVAIMAGSVVLLAVAAPVYGLPRPTIWSKSPSGSGSVRWPLSPSASCSVRSCHRLGAPKPSGWSCSSLRSSSARGVRLPTSWGRPCGPSPATFRSLGSPTRCAGHGSGPAPPPARSWSWRALPLPPHCLRHGVRAFVP